MNIILVGKSGCGKDFARKYLISEYGFEPIISHTTRPMREGEIDGKDYWFINEDRFIEADYNNEFIETRSYNVDFEGKQTIWHYGTNIFEFKHRGLLTVAIKDLAGAKQIKEQFPNTKIVYIHCDDIVRECRAKSRGSFDKTEWDRRLKADAIDFNFEDIITIADYYVTNNEGEVEFKQQLDIVLEMILESEDN